jgi:four helix bundle protein
VKVNRFEELRVWQKSRDLALAVYRLTSRGAFARDFGLRDQIRRAAVSVMSNIAEGFGRYTLPGVRRFVVIARGSVAEVQSQLYLARDRGYLPVAEHQAMNSLCVEISRMLAVLRTTLNSRSPT